ILDLMWPRMKNMGGWAQSAVGGTVFLAVLIAGGWPVSAFLFFPAANNRFFAPNKHPYFALAGFPGVRPVFLAPESTPTFLTIMAMALVVSIVSMWLGVVFGDWLKRVKR